MVQEQKKLRTLLSEKEAMPHLKRPGCSFGRTSDPCNVNRKRVDAGRPAAPSVRSGASSSGGSSGGASASAADLLGRPRSSAAGAGQCGEFFKGSRRLSSSAPYSHIAVPKGGSMSSSLALSWTHSSKLHT